MGKSRKADEEMNAKTWKMQDRNHRKWYNNHGNMDGKQKYGKMQAWEASKSIGKCMHGRQTKVWENAGT